MSKKVFWAVLMLSLTSVLAFAGSLNEDINFNSKYKWTELSKEIISPYDEGSVCRLSADLEMTGGVLYLTVNNVPYAGYYSLYYEEYPYSKDIESIKWWYSVIPVFEGKIPFYNLIRLKYKVEEIPATKTNFIFSIFYDVNFSYAEKVVDLYEGCCYHIEMNNDEGNINRRRVPFYNMEWIVYNPCDNQGNERFFQLRYGKKAEIYGHSWDDMLGYGKHAMMYPVLMCDTERFDEAKADTIAMMSAVYDLNEVTAVRAYDVDIPSEFWATGLPEAAYNPSKWPTFNGTKDVKHVYDINKEYGGFNFYNFDGDRFSMWFDNGLGSEETSLGTFQTRMVGTSNVAADSRLQAKWMQIFGAVGDDYASNLPYPCYELPAGAKPAYLLCVRDFTTGEVLYGDDSKLPDTLGVKELPADETVGTGDGRTHYYNLQGVEVKNPEKGLYIRVKNGKAEKILITE